MRMMLRSTLAILTVAATLGTVAGNAEATLPELVNSKGEALVRKKFTFTELSSSYTFFETLNKHDMICTKGAAKGEISGTRGGEATFTLTGCHIGYMCNSAGDREGEITFTASIAPVWLNKAKEEVALLISLPKTTGVQLKCDNLSIWTVTVSGSLLLRVPVNKLSATYTLDAQQLSGKQEFSEYENEADEKVKATLESESADGLENWAKQQSAMEAGWKVAFEEEAEFRA